MWVKWRHGVMTVFPLFEWVITHEINISIKLVRWVVIKKWVWPPLSMCDEDRSLLVVQGEVEVLAHSWSSFKGWVE